ncbi:MAG TPA: transcription elongation factor GreA [Acidimicrobiales bacterium]|nr:transcription elongation factor GreA [Acidimicrobiales bacterium]
MATVLSREAHQRLSEEYADLTTRGRVDIARQIEKARELGDLKENSDYHAAKDAQGKMESRIRQLAALLEDAEIVDEQTAPGDAVGPGTIVAIRYEGDDDVEKFLVGSIEEKPDDEDVTVVSPDSPLGKELIGKKKGEVFAYDAPGGQLKVEIVEIGAP